MNARRICCAAYGGGHIRAVLPVLLALREREWDVTLLALTIAGPIAREAGLCPLSAADFLEEGDSAIRAYGERLVQDLPVGSGVPHDESVAYLGFGYAGLVQAVGSVEAEAVYRRKGRGALLPTLLVQRLLDRSRPDVVLATNAPRAERALIELAGARSIRAVCLNDLLAPATDAWLFDPGFADRLCVLNDYVRERFIAFGQKPAKVVVTGNPAFASLTKHRRGSRPRVPSATLRVLYVSQKAMPGDESHFQSFRKAVLALAQARPGLSVTVRPHPGEGDTAWIVPPLRREAVGVTVEQSFENADVVVSHGSTMALEASLFGLPVLLDVDNHIAARAPLHLAGFAYPLASLDNLSAEIDRAVALGPVDLPYVAKDPVDAVVSVIEQVVKQ